MTNSNNEMIYLDYNATTPVSPEVVDAMSPYWNGIFGNPSSSHRQGRLAREAIERARLQVADLIGVSPAWVTFTGGATEANNMALIGAARKMKVGRRHLIVSAIEHPAVLEPAKTLQREGWCISIAPVDGDGCIRLDEFERLLRDDTSLVSVMHANNETGSIQAIAQIARITRSRGIVLHTDAAQSAGKIPVRVADLGVDMLVLAGHKFYAPKGVGALIRDPAIVIEPLDFGAGHESGLRPGTENVPLIVGLGEAALRAGTSLGQRGAHMLAMRDRLHACLSASIPGLILNGHATQRLPNTLNVSLPRCDAKAVLAQLTDIVAASAGSACHSDSETVSGVLGAMQVGAERASAAIRFSVGIDTTEAEVVAAARHVASAWSRHHRP